jgi:hypothetical protein
LAAPGDMEISLKIVDEKLRIEREKRTIAEQHLEEVERECRNPFIVPAVFKAFVEVSRLTNGMKVTT